MSSTEVSAASSTAASPSPRRSARRRTGARIGGGDLDQECRLADPRVAAKEQDRAAHQAASGHPVEFGYAGSEPGGVQRFAFERFDDEQAAFARSSAGRGNAFLGD